MRHDRRRRLFADDAENGDDEPTPIRLAGGDASGVQGYSDAVRAARHRAICTLVPLGKLSIALAVGCCLLAVGGCLGLHVAADWLAAKLDAEAVTALRLDAPASLGRWLGSTLLGLASALSLFIFSLRRHRLDDYHGRYRVWISLALVCLLVSLVESTGLAALGKAVVRLVAERGSLRFDIVWPVTLATLITLIGVRLAIEIRRSATALVALGFVALSFTFTASVYRAWPVAWNEATAPLWACGGWLLGYVLVLTTLLLYARHVQLEVSGAAALPAKPKRKKKPVEQESESEPAPRKPALKLRTDLDPVQPSSMPAAETKAPLIAASKRDDESTIRSPSSRAERRKMKQDRRMAS